MAAECFLPVRPGSRGGVAGGGPGWQPGILHLSSTCLAHSHLPLGPPRFSPRCMSVSLSGSNGQPTDISPPTKRFLNTTSFSVFISVGFRILGESICHRVDSLPICETLSHKTTWTKTTLDSSSSYCGQLSNIEVANVSSSSPRGKPKDFDLLLTIPLTMVDNCSPAKLKFCRFLARLERLVRR